MQCKEWDDANSELFKESHDEAVHKNSYKSRLYELISASLGGRQLAALASPFGACGTTFPLWCLRHHLPPASGGTTNHSKTITP